MVSVNLHELKARFSEYTRMVKNGETVIVCERNKPIGEFRPLPLESKSGRPAPGLFKGKFPVTDAFFAADREIAGDLTRGKAGTSK